MFNDWLPKEKRPWFVTFINFVGLNTPITASFQAIYMTELNDGLGKDDNKQLPWVHNASSSTPWTQPIISPVAGTNCWNPWRNTPELDYGTQLGNHGQVHPCVITILCSPRHLPTSLLLPTQWGEMILLVDTVNKALRHDEQRSGNMTTLSLTHSTHRRRDLFQGSEANFDGAKAWIFIGLGDLVFPWLPPNSNSGWKVKEGRPSSSLGLGCSPKQSDRCGQHSLMKPFGAPHRSSTSYELSSFYLSNFNPCHSLSSRFPTHMPHIL